MGDAPPTDAEWRLIETELERAARVRAARPDDPAPYVGHMTLETVGRRRELLIASRTVVTDGLTAIDWQKAPLAEVFFGTAEGEDYEVEVGDQVRAGRLLHRCLVRFDRGVLVEIETADALLVRTPEGPWRVQPRPAPLLAPRPPAERAHPPSPVLVPLDPHQTQAVERPRGHALLVLGEAGCGKTTVALHRVARLAREGGPGFRAAVLVPTEGLRRLSEIALGHLGASQVKAWVVDRWAGEQARRVFAPLPTRESTGAGAGVLRVKRHPALRVAMDALVAQMPRRGRPRRADLLHLFGDSALLAQAASASGGALTEGALAETLEHTRVQFRERAEDAFAHVDADRLHTVDGRSIDAGTPTEDAGTIDVEDYAVLFELERRRALARGDAPVVPAQYDAIVVDEAQELSPFDLTLIGRCLRPGGTLVVAGDAGQQVDPSAAFGGWEATLTELGAADHEVIGLEHSYRCPPEVTALGRHVLGRGAEGPWPGATPGGPVVRRRYDEDARMVATLGDALVRLAAADPNATCAVITRTRPSAHRYRRLLDRALPVRLSLDGDFAFTAGVQVTTVEEVKGLEFDHVVVPDASSAAYPDTPEARRALYVAITRASHQCVLASVGTGTPLLPPSS